MYFALTHEDANGFAQTEHHHEYTHLLTCDITRVTQQDFVDLRVDGNVIVKSEFGTLPKKQGAPAFCKHHNKKGVIWKSQAPINKNAWTELCLYPDNGENEINNVTIIDVEPLNT